MKQNLEWLKEASGPIIKYRIMNEILKFDNSKEREDAIGDLMECREVNKWIERLDQSKRLHG